MTDRRADHSPAFDRVGSHVGLSLSATQVAMLHTYREFLGSEAVAAGGIGPAEGDRLGDRHIADSMMFLTGIPTSAVSVADIGSGVGLPGIPMAICRPDLTITLVDRSQRRTDLAARAVRILDLGNVQTLTMDVSELPGGYDVLTFRASLTVESAAQVLQDRQDAHIVGLFGVSRLHAQPELPEPPVGLAYRLTEESKGVLDSPFWLLRMTSA